MGVIKRSKPTPGKTSTLHEQMGTETIMTIILLLINFEADIYPGPDRSMERLSVYAIEC